METRKRRSSAGPRSASPSEEGDAPGATASAAWMECLRVVSGGGGRRAAPARRRDSGRAKRQRLAAARAPATTATPAPPPVRAVPVPSETPPPGTLDIAAGVGFFEAASRPAGTAALLPGTISPSCTLPSLAAPEPQADAPPAAAACETSEDDLRAIALALGLDLADFAGGTPMQRAARMFDRACPRDNGNADTSIHKALLNPLDPVAQVAAAAAPRPPAPSPPRPTPEPEPERPAGEMFSGMRVLLVTSVLGPTSSARVRALSSQLQARGAVLVDRLQPGVTHVVSDGSDQSLRALPPELTPTALRASHPSAVAVRAEWVSACIRLRRLQPTADFLLRDPPSLPRPTEPEPAPVAPRGGKQQPRTLPGAGGEVGRRRAKWNPLGEPPKWETTVPSRVSPPLRRSARLSGGGDDAAPSSSLVGSLSNSSQRSAGVVVPANARVDAISHKFACQLGVDELPNLVNHNEHLTGPLQEMEEIHHALGEEWKEGMYKKTATILRGLDFRVETPEDLNRVPRLPRGNIRERLVQILATGRMEKLDALRQNPQVVSTRLFAQVWGIGTKTAEKLYRQGYRTLADLHGCPELTPQQRVGLRHYDDLLQRIPRAEMTALEARVRETVHELCPGATAEAVGSYRRGKASSGDIDVLISHPDGHSHHGLLPRVLASLRTQGFITDDLSTGDVEARFASKTHEGGLVGKDFGNESYMGVCRLDEHSPHRRVDLKVYHRDCLAFALLYFTGSDHFNRSMRLFAKKKGFSLSDLGLLPATRVGKVRAHVGTKSVRASTEADVFSALGLRYVPPDRREV